MCTCGNKLCIYTFFFHPKAKNKGPWITHETPYGRCVYLNLETLDYSWETPTFFPAPKYINMEEIQASL